MKSTTLLVLFIFTFAGCSQFNSKKTSSRSLATVGSTDVLSGAPTSMGCEAMSLDTNTKYGKVVLQIETGSDPLITLTSKTSKPLNFKIGRRFVAGNDYSADTKMDCRFVRETDDQLTSIRYLCGTSPLPESYNQIRDYPRLSSISYRTNSQIRICKTSRSCVDLIECIR